MIRGCGTRKKGSAYAVTKLSEHGMPMGHFIIDPVIPILDPGALGISPVGIALIERQDANNEGTGIYDLWDWIGAGSSPTSKGYWNVADFIEEGQRYGFSGHLPKNLDFSKVTTESRRILVHPHAYVDQFQQLFADRQQVYCPKHIEMHELSTEESSVMCAGLWWETVEGGHASDEGRRAVERLMPPFAEKSGEQFRYSAWRAPDGLESTYKVAAFIWLPFTLEVIKDDDANTHEETLALLKNSGTDVPFELVEE